LIACAEATAGTSTNANAQARDFRFIFISPFPLLRNHLKTPPSWDMCQQLTCGEPGLAGLARDLIRSLQPNVDITQRMISGRARRLTALNGAEKSRHSGATVTVGRNVPSARGCLKILKFIMLSEGPKNFIAFVKGV
jgi:hypothetical protein